MKLRRYVFAALTGCAALVCGCKAGVQARPLAKPAQAEQPKPVSAAKQTSARDGPCIEESSRRTPALPASARKPPAAGEADRRSMTPANLLTDGNKFAQRATSIDRDEQLPIDLPTALRLADATNPQLAVTREQIRAAYARLDAASVLWLPSIRGGVNYNRHDGSIQAVDGTQFNTDRGALYSGLGGGVYGAGTPIVPGVYANFHLSDAIFEPLAARQYAWSRRRAANAAGNDLLLNVAQAYLELLRAAQDQAIAAEVERDARQLVELTAQYARTGQGLQADADRMHAEWTVRRNDVLRADEARQVAAARLAQLLHLDPTLNFTPVEPVVVPIDMISPHEDLRELVARGLSNRPELAEARLLVAEAATRLRRERMAPLIPSFLLGTSYGAMGAGIGGNLAPAVGRLDLDAIAYWELRNMGLGDKAARENAGSAARQAQLRQLATMDLVAREVAESYAQVQARRRQIAIAREGIEAALASHQRNLERIEAARGLPIEALQSVQALAVSRRELLRTLIEYNLAQFSLYRALGWPGGASGASVPRNAAPRRSEESSVTIR